MIRSFLAVVAVLALCPVAHSDEARTLPGDVAPGTEYKVRHVRVESGQEGIVLSGEITIPLADGKHPAILLITGNGPHTREQIISGCPTFRLIGDRLTAAGFAVMRLDARGYGFSTGPDELQTTTLDRTKDIEVALSFLQRQQGIDPDRIGVLGHSEGAMIATMLGARQDDLAFMILLGSPGEPGGAVWVRQKLRQLREKGATDETLAKVELAFDEFVAQAGRGFESDDQYYDLGKRVLLAHGVADDEATREFVDRIVSDLREPWYRFFLGWNPEAYLPSLKIPVLAVWGELDSNVPPEHNAGGVAAMLAAAKNDDATVRVLDGEDHFFLRRNGAAADPHAYGRMYVSEQLIETLVSWAHERTRQKPQSHP